MAITYPITLPTEPDPVSIHLTANNVVGFSQSIFTGQQQTHRHDGAWWRAEITLPTMTREQAEDWVAAILSLRGRHGTFYLGDPAGRTPRGVATGTPVVDGASQTGDSINVRGFTASVTGILKAGDYIQMGDQLHRVLVDADSDGTGDTTLDVWPPVRTAHADGTTVVTSNTKGKFRLAGNTASWSVDPGVFYKGLTIQAVEAV